MVVPLQGKGPPETQDIERYQPIVGRGGTPAESVCSVCRACLRLDLRCAMISIPTLLRSPYLCLSSRHRKSALRERCAPAGHGLLPPQWPAGAQTFPVMALRLPPANWSIRNARQGSPLGDPSKLNLQAPRPQETDLAAAAKLYPPG